MPELIISRNRRSCRFGSPGRKVCRVRIVRYQGRIRTIGQLGDRNLITLGTNHTQMLSGGTRKNDHLVPVAGAVIDPYVDVTTGPVIRYPHHRSEWKIQVGSRHLVFVVDLAVGGRFSVKRVRIVVSRPNGILLGTGCCDDAEDESGKNKDAVSFHDGAVLNRYSSSIKFTIFMVFVNILINKRSHSAFEEGLFPHQGPEIASF